MMLLGPFDVARLLCDGGFGREPFDVLGNAVMVAFAESSVPGGFFVASDHGYVPSPSPGGAGAGEDGFPCCDNESVYENRDAAGNVTSRDWGFMQINDLHHLGPGKPTPAQLQADPALVARFAYGLYVDWGNSFGSWVSFTNGSYLRYQREASWGLSKLLAAAA